MTVVSPPDVRAGGSPQAAVLARARPDLFGPSSPGLRASVIVPARDEARRLPALLAALDAQRDADGRPFADGTVEALVLVNNSTDGSAEVARACAPPWVRVAEIALAPGEAHVGTARRVLMDAACARLWAAGAPAGPICSTDADTCPAPDWLAATLDEISDVDAVGGRALLLPDERAGLAPGVRRFALFELAYRRAVESLRQLYAPEPWDPTPRHHHHFGASLAVRADAYAAVGGLPARPMHEDIALVHALWAAGLRVRHSARVRVWTSARSVGRARGGLANDVARWTVHARAGTEPTVETAAGCERRLARLGLDRARFPDRPPPVALLDTPPAPPDGGQHVSLAVADLRARIAVVESLSPCARLDRARRLAVTALPMPALPTGDGQSAPAVLATSDPVEAARAVAAEVAPRAAQADRLRRYLDADLDALRSSGLLTLTLPEAEGGAGLGAPDRLHELLTALRHVGRGSLPLGRLFEGHVDALLRVASDGTAAQRARLFADARAGHLFAVWNTEVPAEGVRLKRRGDRVEMAGAKTFATGCAVVTRPLVTGRLGGPRGGWQQAVVRADTAPVAVEPEAWRAEGMRATGSGVTRFDGVVLAPADLLGAPDRYYAEPAFSGGAVRFLAVQTGGAEALADAVAEHLDALGRAEHPGQQARFGEIEAAVETARLWLLGVARLWARPAATDAERVAAVQAARGAVERACTDVMRLADHAAGARGLGQPGPLERVARDLRLYLRQPDPDGALVAAGAFALGHRQRARGSDL
ncbi:acyl-CoA dehydrogenase family protein [Rubrivirga sp.]|uniref:acyl-CoA dehydrogenase family protein n=1 Tax=Rubrivirga sp. TaxID=1885344 RepID=UPI003B51F14B